MMYRSGGVSPYHGVAGNYPPGHARAFDETSAVNHLRKNQMTNEENFMERIKDWETSTQNKWTQNIRYYVKKFSLFSLNVNKIEDAGELPGLMIEEMMESASMVQGEEEGAVRETDEKVDMSFDF